MSITARKNTVLAQPVRIFSNPAVDFKGLISARLKRSGRKNCRAAARTTAGLTSPSRFLNSSGLQSYGHRAIFSQAHIIWFSLFSRLRSIWPEVIARAAQFRRRRHSDARRFISRAMIFKAFSRLSRCRPGDDNVPGVIEKAVAAVNRIRQGVLFADSLEQARTHVLAQDDVEEAQRETPFVVAGTGPDTEGGLGLFGLARVKVDGGPGLSHGGGRVSWALAPGEFPADFLTALTASA